MGPRELTSWLAARPRVLDGAMGSELLHRGVQAAARLWGVGALLEAPDAVRALHRDYVTVGAEALTTATFRVTRHALRAVGMEEMALGLAKRAVGLARDAAREAGRDVLVLGSQTTLADCYRPELAPDDATAAAEHATTSRMLVAAGADGILLETLNTIHEARVAALAAAETGVGVIVSFACRAGGHLLSGEEVGDAAAAVSVPGVVAIGVNCTRRVDVMPALNRLAAATSLPLVAYANEAWYAEDSSWLAAEPAGPEIYARCALAWVAAGARLVGGCCGTGPAHIAAVARILRGGG